MREGYHAPQTCLPPLVGGRGTTKWWKGAAEGGIIKTAAKPPPPPSEPGPWSGPSSRPLPSRCARHPPPGRGWAGNMEEKNVASNRHIPFCGGKRVPRPSNLPPTARRGEGDHEMVEGGCRRRHYKKTAAKPPPSPSARRAVKPKNLTNPRGKAPSTLMCAFCIECASQPKLALSLHIKGPSYCRLTVRRRVQCAQIISKILLSAGEVPAPAFSGGRPG